MAEPQPEPPRDYEAEADALRHRLADIEYELTQAMSHEDQARAHFWKALELAES
jgi:hypothetical protein